MAGPVPAICSSMLPRRMAGTKPGHDGQNMVQYDRMSNYALRMFQNTGLPFSMPVRFAW
jgi:hypothetical protein